MKDLLLCLLTIPYCFFSVNFQLMSLENFSIGVFYDFSFNCVCGLFLTFVSNILSQKEYFDDNLLEKVE